MSVSNGQTAGETAPSNKSGVVLECGAGNNFILWQSYLQDEGTFLFGFPANVFRTFVPYVVPLTVVADYLPAGPAGYTPAAILVMRLAEEKNRLQEVHKLKAQAPKMYAWIWHWISLASRLEVRIKWQEVWACQSWARSNWP